MTSTILHLHCGDASAEALRQSGVPGDVWVWCDILMDGPLPRTASLAEWIETRANVLSQTTGQGLTPAPCADRLREQDRALAGWAEYEETVLWFDACLYDQTILLRHLDWFSRQKGPTDRLRLICLGSHPAHPRFLGLGQLTAQDLAAVWPERAPIKPPQFLLARNAWRAFCDATPVEWAALLTRDLSALPYLQAAVLRHLEELPALSNGLSRLERELLESVAAGARSLPLLFKTLCDKEDRPYFGDTYVWAVVERLAAYPAPLLVVSGPGPIPRWGPMPDLTPWTLALTPVGLDVLSGKKDHLRLNGVDRWVGGFHIKSGVPVWRWDDINQRVCLEPG